MSGNESPHTLRSIPTSACGGVSYGEIQMSADLCGPAPEVVVPIPVHTFPPEPQSALWVPPAQSCYPCSCLDCRAVHALLRLWKECADTLRAAAGQPRSILFYLQLQFVSIIRTPEAAAPTRSPNNTLNRCCTNFVRTITYARVTGHPRLSTIT